MIAHLTRKFAGLAAMARALGDHQGERRALARLALVMRALGERHAEDCAQARLAQHFRGCADCRFQSALDGCLCRKGAELAEPPWRRGKTWP